MKFKELEISFNKNGYCDECNQGPKQSVVTIDDGIERFITLCKRHWKAAGREIIQRFREGDKNQ